MGRGSTKIDKNVYHVSRENAQLTREDASEKLFISSDRIEKIENRGSIPHPDEVLAMADTYKDPMLCNYYCSHECPIGQAYIPEVQLKDISQITLEVLATMNKLSKVKERLVDITVDGVVEDSEIKDFGSILDILNKMSLTIESLKMWVKNEMIAGNIDPNALDVNS